ncbi:Fe-S cluster assembly protein HesB [Candidatus Gottesmanbacteria bacterium]|nr:Fe-S cluster assembly protein HesB [Candidatus Gottesmanbacteria bacterium]
MKLTSRQIRAFQKKIFLWWKKNRRDLPWRHTHDPYKILVSEVMLQQTQVLRVVAKYREFIQRYPTVHSLASASPAAVIRIWKGLGYNRRALYLHRAAKVLVDQHHGRFPINHKLLAKLPGVGIYTAAAVLVFAYKQEVPLVDTNIRQIITHFFFGGKPQKPPIIEDVARQLLPKGKSWEWHQALMDYGALERLKLKRPERSRRTPLPFRETNRFYRGRIIDMLREQDVSESLLLRDLIKKYQKPRIFFQRLIVELAQEGLVERTKKSILGLPN